MIVQDFELFSQIDFSAICCDEAHELKESRTLKSQALKSLTAQAKFLVTGTPIQNNLADYWTLIDIVEPGLLGTRDSFENRAQDTPSSAMQLVELTKHKILRRTQDQVGIEIPDGQEFLIPLRLSEDLFRTYKQIGNSNDKSTPSSGGRGAIQHKRQFCAHPSSFTEPKYPGLGEKASYLVEELRKISDASEKAVVFVADFNEPRDLYRELINSELPEFWTGTIDGRTPNELRHVTLENFKAHSGSAVLLINPLVGGQGLDIVAANHVFHMNPAWNPAKTDQATFRVTRPGQTKETWSHHLYYVETIEESIHNLVSHKRDLSDAALEVAEAAAAMNQQSLLNILK
jgi:SNF2 family DNA or RNA helicase